MEENYIPTLLAPAYLAPASTHTSAAVQPAPVQVQYAQPVQYVYAQPAHSQATVQPQYVYIQPPQITQPASKHPQVYLASSSHTPTQGQSWYPDSGASHHVTGCGSTN